MTKQLPARPHPSHLKNQAKQLLKGHQSADAESIRRIGALFPKLGGNSEAEIAVAEFCLQDAKLVIAREYGFATWQELMAVVPGETSSSKEDPPAEVTYGDEDLVRVTIELHPADIDVMNTMENITVILAGEDGRAVVLAIGCSEAQALSRALEGRPPARPLAYNVVNEMMTMFGGRIEGLVVHSLENEVFYAHLMVNKEGKVAPLDCRPSDGMVMAVENEAPVFVTGRLLEHVGRRSSALD